jgi:hypothetical protein
MLRWPSRRERPELQAFENWLLAQAADTCRALEPMPAAPSSAKMPHAPMA